MSTLEYPHPATTNELLTTKLTPPHLSSSLVSRESLFARLDCGLDTKLTLVSAPTGFGKTTLVADWLANRTASGAISAVAWISLDAGDNDPVRFWQYLIAACQRFQPGLGNTSLAMLQSADTLPFESPRIPFEAVLTALLNELSQLSTPCVLVLDDYHVINLGQLHKAVDFLLEHLPSTVHLLIVSRSEPPFSLTRLRVRNALVELHIADLRFSKQDTEAFIQQTLSSTLTEETVSRLHARTEGWMAGLNVVALALQKRTAPEDQEHFLTTFNGSHRHILEYLVSDVFDAQSEALQIFLLKTSGLSRLTASLCDAVVEGHDSASILHEMERANLFLESLDDSQWYRYHALFAEAMQYEALRRLGEEAICVCHNRASEWYEQHGLLAEAIESALSAQNFPRVVALVKGLIGTQHIVPPNTYYSVRIWLAQIPKSVLYSAPSVCFVYAMAVIFSDYHRRPLSPELEEVLQMVEQGFKLEGDMAKLGELFAFRALLAMWQEDINSAASFARQSLQWLPDNYALWKSIDLGMLGAEHWLNGMFNTARQLLLEARTLSEQAGNSHGTRPLSLALGDICFAQGELHQAEVIYQQVLADSAQDYTDQGRTRVSQGRLFYEWNDLDTAEQNAQEAILLGQQAEDVVLQTQASLLLARVQHARRQHAQAQSTLTTLIGQMQPYIPTLLYRELVMWQARFKLDTGDLVAAHRWWLAIREDSRTPTVQQEQEELLAARLLIAQQRPTEALNLLRKWQDAAHNGRRTSSELEIQLLMVEIYIASNQLKEAQQSLQAVLAVTRAEGYQRFFLDEGAALVPLLREALSDAHEQPLATYIRSLLDAFNADKGISAKSNDTALTPIAEPLSQQEERVLRLFATGHSREEIASELVVSVNTVKTHLQRVYRKLNVTSRQEARKIAHNLYLL